jgi:hypothetical protein
LKTVGWCVSDKKPSVRQAKGKSKLAFAACGRQFWNSSSMDPESSIENPIEKAEIIPDFFYELISRIMPGFMAIAILVYASGNHLVEVFSRLELSVFLLMLAWVFGIILDVGFFCTVKFICADFLPRLRGKTLWEGIWKPKRNLWKYSRTARPWERGMLNKSEAQMIFFRTMALICFLLYFLCLLCKIFSLCDALFPILARNTPHGNVLVEICSPILGGVFLLCWRQQSQSLDEALKELTEQQHRRH